VPYCQKYTPTHCFFSDFAHWILSNAHNFSILTFQKSKVFNPLKCRQLLEFAVSNLDFLHTNPIFKYWCCIKGNFKCLSNKIKEN